LKQKKTNPKISVPDNLKPPLKKEDDNLSLKDKFRTEYEKQLGIRYDSPATTNRLKNAADTIEKINISKLLKGQDVAKINSAISDLKAISKLASEYTRLGTAKVRIDGMIKALEAGKKDPNAPPKPIIPLTRPQSQTPPTQKKGNKPPPPKIID